MSKKSFLRGRFNGITEYLAKKTNSESPVMLIYNKQLAVSPLTTHTHFKGFKICKNKDIVGKIKIIDHFYKIH